MPQLPALFDNPGSVSSGVVCTTTVYTIGNTYVVVTKLFPHIIQVYELQKVKEESLKIMHTLEASQLRLSTGTRVDLLTLPFMRLVLIFVFSC